MSVSLAVIGATGMLGYPVAQELVWAGYDVRIVARDVDNANRLFPHVAVVRGDLRDPASLVAALHGIDIVYLNLSVRPAEKEADFHPEGEGLTNLLAAAKQAGVRRIGYLSSLVMRYAGTNGFRWWVFELKHEAVRRIKESGIPYSIFYPSCFMESLNATQRAGSFVLLAGHSTVRPWYVSAHDYGKQVARAFRLVTDTHQSQEYVIQGPEALRQQEAAQRFVAAYTAEKLRVLTMPSWLLKLGLPFSAQANYGWHITEAINSYPEQFEAGKTWTDLGKPETTVDIFARG